MQMVNSGGLVLKENSDKMNYHCQIIYICYLSICSYRDTACTFCHFHKGKGRFCQAPFL